jgi:hypothetical protein
MQLVKILHYFGSLATAYVALLVAQFQAYHSVAEVGWWQPIAEIRGATGALAGFSLSWFLFMRPNRIMSISMLDWLSYVASVSGAVVGCVCISICTTIDFYAIETSSKGLSKITEQMLLLGLVAILVGLIGTLCLKTPKASREAL